MPNDRYAKWPFSILNSVVVMPNDRYAKQPYAKWPYVKRLYAKWDTTVYRMWIDWNEPFDRMAFTEMYHLPETLSQNWIILKWN